ncbi:MAG TPA: hypothetical protein VIL74_03000 [Pyrinomonadaceae bacterium]|jgi:hypothetical protein
MGSTKHEKSFVDYDKPYEQNLIGMRGIVYFGVGLFLLIVVTFGLMWALQNVMEDDAAATKDRQSPLALSEQEKLPPEPRLQAAPGFGVDSQNGRVNLELRAPQSEYRELQKHWNELLREGQKDEKTNTVITLPIDEAKKKLLEGGGLKAKTGIDAEKSLDETRTIVSYSSSGRTRSDRRR